MSTTLRSRLLELLSEVLQVEFPADVVDVRRRDCEAWDSVNHFRFILELEAAFGLSLEDEQIAAVTSLDDVEALLGRVAAQA